MCLIFEISLKKGLLLPVVCKLSLTEIKHIFEEDATMLQVSEIVKKTEEMFDLFNEHFYNIELTPIHHRIPG